MVITHISTTYICCNVFSVVVFFVVVVLVIVLFTFSYNVY